MLFFTDTHPSNTNSILRSIGFFTPGTHIIQLEVLTTWNITSKDLNNAADLFNESQELLGVSNMIDKFSHSFFWVIPHLLDHHVNMHSTRSKEFSHRAIEEL